MDQSAGLIRQKQTSARRLFGAAQRLWGLMSKDLAQAIHVSIGIVSLAFVGVMGCSLDSSQTDATEAGTTGSNHTPVIRSVTLAPIPIVREGVVTATVEADDLDRDALTFTFKWIVNDELRPEEVSSTFHPEGLNRGDRVAVEVIPHDGKVSGPPDRRKCGTVDRRREEWLVGSAGKRRVRRFRSTPRSTGEIKSARAGGFPVRAGRTGPAACAQRHGR